MVVASGNRKQRGFSLTELIIAIAVSAIIIMMSSDVFTTVLTQSAQQARLMNSEMESIIGLRMLRYDVEHAGFGLAAELPGGTAYQEAASAPANGYNDAPGNVPRAVLAGNGVAYNGSDRLVIKSTAAGPSDTAQMWTYMLSGGVPKVWGSAKLDLVAANRVIVISPKTDETTQNKLVTGANFYTQFGNVAAFATPTGEGRVIIYGVDPDTDLRMPFNRVDYYVSRPAGMSPSCAPNTGILYKANVNQADGQLNEAPIIDCVADMQVIFRRDTNADGGADSEVEDITGLSAQQIREGIKEVRVYILAQEGKRDQYYRHTPSVIAVGEFGLGRNFDLAARIGAGWENYRWKLYTIVVKPKQLQ